MQIPKIIHQIWSGVDEPLPEHFKELGKTWKRDYPDWEYIQWDNQMINMFVKEHYPEYWEIYTKFPYNIQRWDAIRYLILEKIGGMYVDFDYESIEPMDKLIENKTCCFALEPESHFIYFRQKIAYMFNNALMQSIPKHPFMSIIVETIFSEKTLNFKASSKDVCVMFTTGPWRLIELYKHLSTEEKDDIYLIPAKYVTPFDLSQANRFRMGEISEELENCLEEAHAVHYFFSNWRESNK